MLYASIALFAIAAIFGLTILLKWVSQKTASSTVIYSHGLFAVLGLVILIVYSVQNPDNFPKTSLILFGITALGGLTMFFRNASNLSGKKFSFFGDPQIWVSLYKGFGVGSKINLYYHTLTDDNRFQVYPTVAVKYQF